MRAPRWWAGRRRAWVGAAVILVLAAGFAGWANWSWWRAGDDAQVGLAQARDAVLAAGTSEIQTMDSMDYRQADAGVRAWLAATTGALHDSLQRSQAASVAQMQQGRTIAVGQVLVAAVTELDQNAGTAELIASVRITLTPATGAASTERNRYRAGLTRTGAGWQLSSLTAIPVSAG